MHYWVVMAILLYFLARNNFMCKQQQSLLPVFLELLCLSAVSKPKQLIKNNYIKSQSSTWPNIIIRTQVV